MECHDKSISEEVFQILPLPIAASLEECIQCFLEIETLNGANKWFCGGCSAKRDAIRTTTFVELPDILIIQLKRFDNKLLKNDSFIKYPVDELSIPINDGVVSLNYKYSLKATINHTGSLKNGHYKAVVRNNLNGAWFTCNDNAVLSTNKVDVISCSTYMLIYGR